jgi:tetratricopeptide (TPR) repeat protein
MEYVDAGTLKDQMETPMTLKDILNLVKQISSALDYAHELGVVHRDVKPSNILMPKPDWALLTDFGLAKMVGGTFMTQSGLTVGTPAYMSPEQGGGHKVDNRTDIYSLGVMLYELVVGEVPYTAETPMAVVVKHIVDPLPMPRAKNPNVPEELQRVILKALAKNPDDRYQTAGEIAASMEAVVADDPDWSVAGITVVDAVREPVEDVPSTKMLDEEEIEEGEVPLEVEPATTVDEVAPLVEDVGELEEETVRPVDEPTYSEPVVVAEPVSGVRSKLKNKKWAYALGGVAALVVCGVIGAFAANALQPQIEEFFGQSSNNNVVVDDELGQPDFPDDDSQSDGDFGQPDFPDDQQPPPEDDGRTLFDEGVHYLGQNNILRAAESFHEALKVEPRLWGEFFPVVIDEFESGDFESALQLFRAGVEAHPNPPLDDLSGFAWMLLEVERAEESYEIFFKIIEEVPSYFDAYYGLSNAASYMHREYEALEYMTAQVERVPDNPYVLSAIADTYYWLAEYENCLIYYERAMELNPEDSMIYMWSVEVYIIVGEIDAAIDKIDTARRLGPERSDIAEMAGLYYRDLGMLQQALEAFEQAVALDQGLMMPKVYLAQVLIDLGVEQDRATELLIEAERIGRDFHDYWALYEVAWTWVYLGECGRALDVFYLIESETWEIDVSEGLLYCGG